MPSATRTALAKCLVKLLAGGSSLDVMSTNSRGLALSQAGCHGPQAHPLGLGELLPRQTMCQLEAVFTTMPRTQANKHCSSHQLRV